MSTFEVISIWDEAIDWPSVPADVRDAYADSETAQRDISLLDPYRIAGKTPTIYTLRECPQAQWITFVREATTRNMQAYHALLVCLVSAKDLQSAEGMSMGPEHKFARFKSDVARPESLARIRIPVLEDIAEVAFQRSFFQSETDYAYQLQPSCREQHAAWVARRAAASRRSPDPSNGPASPGLSAGTAP